MFRQLFKNRFEGGKRPPGSGDRFRPAVRQSSRFTKTTTPVAVGAAGNEAVLPTIEDPIVVKFRGVIDRLLAAAPGVDAPREEVEAYLEKLYGASSALGREKAVATRVMQSGNLHDGARKRIEGRTETIDQLLELVRGKREGIEKILNPGAVEEEMTQDAAVETSPQIELTPREQDAQLQYQECLEALRDIEQSDDRNKAAKRVMIEGQMSYLRRQYPRAFEAPEESKAVDVTTTPDEEETPEKAAAVVALDDGDKDEIVDAIFADAATGIDERAEERQNKFIQDNPEWHQFVPKKVVTQAESMSSEQYPEDLTPEDVQDIINRNQMLEEQLAEAEKLLMGTMRDKVRRIIPREDWQKYQFASTDWSIIVNFRKLKKLNRDNIEKKIEEKLLATNDDTGLVIFAPEELRRRVLSNWAKGMSQKIKRPVFIYGLQDYERGFLGKFSTEIRQRILQNVLEKQSKTKLF